MTPRTVAFAFAVFALAVALPLSARTAEPDLSADQKRQIERVIDEYLRANPEVIIEAIQGLQARKQAEQQERIRQNLIAAKSELLNDPDSPVAGNADGSVTVVEFFDYRCQYCIQMYPVVREILRTDADVRFVFKEFPILTPESRIAARIATAVWRARPDKYFDFHGEVLSTRGSLNEGRLLAIAARQGIGADEIEKHLNQTEIDAALDRNYALAQRLGIQGTPGFVIGDAVVPGAMKIEDLRGLIAKARGG